MASWLPDSRNVMATLPLKSLLIFKCEAKGLVQLAMDLLGGVF